MEKIWLVLIILVAALIGTFIIGFWSWAIAGAIILSRIIINAIRK